MLSQHAHPRREHAGFGDQIVDKTGVTARQATNADSNLRPDGTEETGLAAEQRRDPDVSGTHSSVEAWTCRMGTRTMEMDNGRHHQGDSEEDWVVGRQGA